MPQTDSSPAAWDSQRTWTTTTQSSQATPSPPGTGSNVTGLEYETGIRGNGGSWP